MDLSDALARICADTRAETARRKQATSQAVLEARIAEKAEKPRGFAHKLRNAAAGRGIGLIAEIKKASPSGGLIRPDFDPAALARAYEAATANCLSVLTDTPHFQGDAAHLAAARGACALPVLRKDFMLEPWQIYESRAMGADCVLLILAALSDDQASELEAAAAELKMDVLLEVHNKPELDRAMRMKGRMVGINNRNLKTLETDLSTTIDLARNIPSGWLIISESGVRSNDDIKRLRAAGAHAYLVGESLLRQADVTAATKALLGVKA